MIRKIARNEIANLIYTPIVWLLFIVFIVYLGINASMALQWPVNSFEKTGSETHSLFFVIFTHGFNSIYTTVLNILIYLIPLLTMRVMSREESTGSNKLLYSSPIKSSDIIIGKYLGLVVISLLFWLLLVIMSLWIASYIDIINYKLMFAALAAIFLLWLTYLAIGLFISSLTPYQIVAAIGSIALLAALHYSGELWQWMDGLRNITNWLSISGKTNSMFRGLISSSDLFYFFSIITFFLSLTIYIAEFKRSSQPKRVSLTRNYSFGLLIIIGLTLLASNKKHIKYFDVTEHKSNTLNEVSQSTLQGIDEAIKVTTYVNVLSSDIFMGLPRRRISDINSFSEYERFLPGWEMNYVYYYQECYNPRLFSKNKDISLENLAKKVCKTEHINFKKVLSPDKIDQLIDLSEEKYKFVRKLDYKGQSTFLRLFNDRQKAPSEAEITAALNSFLNPPMTIGVLQGNSERDMYGEQNSDIKNVLTGRFTRSALINNGFVPEKVDLSKNISDNLVFLLIADPVEAYSPNELEKIHQYINNGGNLVINGSVESENVLYPILSRFDIELGKQQLVELDRFGNYSQISSYSHKQVGEKLNEAIDLDHYYTSLPKATRIVLPPSIMPLTDSSEVLSQSYNYTTSKGETFEYIPVLATSDTAWLELNSNSINSRSRELSCDTALGETKKSYQTAIALTRKINGKEQKIVIVSSADFISNDGIIAAKHKKMTSQGNGVFFKGLMRWMSDGEMPIYIKRKEDSDRHFYMGIKQLKTLKIIWLGVLPIGLLVFSSLLLWRRKRR